MGNSIRNSFLDQYTVPPLTPQLLFTYNASYDLTLTPQEYDSICTAIQGVDLYARKDELQKR